MICITDKIGLIHIVDFGSLGKYRTICNKKIYKTDGVNIFATDAAVKTGCRACHSTYDEMYVDDLEGSTRAAKSSLMEYLTEMLRWTTEGILTPEYKYADSIERNSHMISKLKRKYLTRASNHVPPAERR